MGGRGGSGGLTSKEINVSGYRIEGLNLYSPSGKRTMMGEYKELRDAYKYKDEMAARALAEKVGIKDPVTINGMILSRNIAEELQSQQAAKVAKEKATFAKNVPGLEKLRRAYEYDIEQEGKFRRSVESGYGRLDGKARSNTYAEVAKQYPRASAYLKAEEWSRAASYAKAEAGREAMKAIASGKPYKKALEDMEKKWDKYTRRRLYD